MRAELRSISGNPLFFSLSINPQVKPVNYTGSFTSSDPVLTSSWYSGAYGSRLNMMPYGFNSILMDRGDRVSIQGDGHPTMAAALAAFGSSDTCVSIGRVVVTGDDGSLLVVVGDGRGLWVVGYELWVVGGWYCSFL